ncbi:FAD-dependent oxidoreductase [Candidatus Poribacteria bacterium]|nr:FAD-dependent oxidoreductase [Candidatus Poribacteria bacterium]
MKKPVVILGGGVAALGAALVLRHAHVPHMVIERESDLGGRLRTLRGQGWIADWGCPYFRLADQALLEVIRAHGLESDVVAVQDGVSRLRQSGEIVHNQGDFAEHRVTLQHGMSSLFDRAKRELEVTYETDVSALRWDAEGKCLLLRDQKTGKTLKDPESGDAVEASGLILAVPRSVVHRVAEASRCLGPLAAAVAGIGYQRSFVGIFKVARTDPGFYALEGEPGSPIQWLGFEERKGPGRVTSGFSLLVARAGGDFASELFTLSDPEALGRLYSQCRGILPLLPEEIAEQVALRWTSSIAVGGESTRRLEDEDLTEPPGLPVAVAGNFPVSDRADFAAESGIRAARRLLKLLGG